MKQISPTPIATALRRAVILAAVASVMSCGAQPVVYPCFGALLHSQNHSIINDARVTVLPPSPNAGLLSISIAGVAELPFCSGTHSFQITHPNYRTKQVTYTSPRDRPVAGNMWGDQITVIMDPP